MYWEKLVCMAFGQCYHSNVEKLFEHLAEWRQEVDRPPAAGLRVRCLARLLQHDGNGVSKLEWVV